MKGQTCTICGKPSIHGLIAGQGKCQYHWNEGVWGTAWADKAQARAPIPPDAMARRWYDFGWVEVTQDSRGQWLWRIPEAGPGARTFSAIGQPTIEAAYDRAARYMRESPPK